MTLRPSLHQNMMSSTIRPPYHRGDLISFILVRVLRVIIPLNPGSVESLNIFVCTDVWPSRWRRHCSHHWCATDLRVYEPDQNIVRFKRAISFASLINLPVRVGYRLKEKGWNISSDGVSVKTNKRLDREDYIDATQRFVVLHSFSE